jgi:tripartite-type tricarboxylate transporter receptor subunit TctC
MKYLTRLRWAMLAVALSLPAGISNADAESFYAGKTIEIIVPAGAGGQMDTGTRLLSKYLERFIDGKPKVRVVNLSGGGGTLGANEYALKRKHDGLHLLMAGTATIFDWILGRSVVQYDYKKMHPLWAAPNPSVVFFPKKTGIKTVKDIKNPAVEIISGVRAPTGPELPTYMMLDMVGLLDGIRVVQGYKSGRDVRAAFAAGEINFGRNSHGSFQRRYGKMLAAGDITPVYTHGFYNAAGKYVRDPKLPDLPNLEEAYTILAGKKPSGTFWDATMLILGINVSGGVNFTMHLDSPKEARQAMDEAMARITADPQFKDEMGKIFGKEYPTTSGAALVAAHQRMTNADPALIEIVRQFLAKKFNYKFN